MFTDLGDVHDFDGRQLSRFDVSSLVRSKKEERLESCNVAFHQNGGRRGLWPQREDFSDFILSERSQPVNNLRACVWS